MAIWNDPSQPAPPPPSDSLMGMGPMSGMGLPPISSYGGATPNWNKETMELIVGVSIPKHVLDKPEYKDFVIFADKLLQQIQFSNLAKSDIREMLKDMRWIFFLSQSQGNEQIFREEQLMLIFKVQALKARNDSPDGLRERTMWITSIMRNIFGEDKPKRPEESKGWFQNLPFGGGRQ